MAFTKNWVFTLNNPTYDGPTLLDLLSTIAGFVVFQKEQGAQGTIHFQGYIQCTIRKRLTSVKKILPTAHWEPARGTPEQCETYCTKTDTRIEGPWTSGQVTTQGQRGDVVAFRDAILEGKSDIDLLEEYALQVAKFPKFISFCRVASFQHRNEKPSVKCFYGRSGSGKTRDALELSGGPDSTFVISRPDSGRPLWWDGYNPSTHLSIILDDFYGWVPWSYLLQLLDRYRFSVEIKGGKVPFNSQKIFITSNQHPQEWYKNIPNNDMTPLLRRIDEIKQYL